MHPSDCSDTKSNAQLMENGSFKCDDSLYGARTWSDRNGADMGVGRLFTNGLATELTEGDSNWEFCREK